MEEFIQLGNAMKHDSFIPHRIFDLNTGNDMPIDLTNLPNGTRLAAPDDPSLLVYFLVPMEALRVRTFTETGVICLRS